jgi:DNA-binding response OmpR family regulator
MDKLIEYKTKQTKDTSQILILENELLSHDAILVIEDSFPIQTLLQKYLFSLGYKDVYIAETGKEGIDLFKNLADLGKIVPILLDDSLPDYSAIEVATKLFQIYCAAKILVMSTKTIDHHDSDLLINKGIYDLIQKPLSFDNIKSMLRKLENHANSTNIVDVKELEKVLDNYKVVSDSEISETMNNNQELFLKTMYELESKGKIKKNHVIMEMACNKCNSVKVKCQFSCPICNSTFTQDTLIEHHSCGNVSEANSYHDDVCPKCHKSLKILGVDYRLLENYYVCNSCKDKFPNPSQIFECQICGNIQKIHEAKWKNSNLYYINPS